MAAAEALFVLSLLGCDDTGAQCDFVRVGEERYETVEACRTASEPLLQASTEADYPTVVAVCSPESALPMAEAEGAGDDVPLPLPPETPAEVDGAIETAVPAEGVASDGIQPGPFPPKPPKAGEEQPQAVAADELPPPPPEKEPGLLARVGEVLSSLAPEKETITKPIDVAAEGAVKVGGAVIVGVKRVAGAVNPF